MRSLPFTLAALALLTACSRNDDATAGPEPGKVAEEKPAAAAAQGPALLHPERATEKAPETFKVKFTTTKGDFVVQVTRAWAPLGADRFYNLVKLGFYDGVRFFRAIEGFMVQFGVHGDPKVSAAWGGARIPDDPVVKSNKRGFVTFAMAGPGSRTSQIFINYADKNVRLDGMGFAPFGEVIEGMNVVDSLHKGYGETAPRGKGPNPGRLQTEGNGYLDREFPDLDSVKSAKLL
jgi:peptidyl-prolyl cis-trans isomerase A (cyclophilin A)